MSKYTEEQHKEVAKILKMPRGPKKWLAARDFALKTSKQARLEHKYFTQEVKKIRENMKSEYGTGEENTGLRYAMRFPESILVAIEMFDPEFDRSSELGGAADANEMKKEWRKVMATFPEYKVLTKI